MKKSNKENTKKGNEPKKKESPPRGGSKPPRKAKSPQPTDQQKRQVQLSDQKQEERKGGQTVDHKKNVEFSQSQQILSKANKETPKIIKGILKKPKASDNEMSMYGSEQTHSRTSSQVPQLQPRSETTMRTVKESNVSSTPASLQQAYQYNQQHLSTQTVDSAFEEYLRVQEEMAARGNLDEAIKNLEDGLNERLGLYPAKDKGVWLISKLLAEIGIRMAVRSLNNDKPDKANFFLKLSRKHTEPLPNSDWNENPEWMLTRKNVFKNLALYYQKKEDWSKAYDCFKVALKLEQDLKENTSNTALTCAVILSKLNRYAESIEFAQNSMSAIEAQRGIDRNKPLGEYKFFGSNSAEQSEYDKQMTTYAIALHLLGKNLANLKYIKEAKVFLSRAQYVAVNMLALPKPDLQLAITNDLNNLNVRIDKVLINNLQKNYKHHMNKKGPANEDIEASLLTIKTNIANSSYSLADQQERKALEGTISNGPPTKLVKNESGKKKKKGDDDDDEEEDKNVHDFMKKFADEKRKKEQQALEDYRKKVQQDFDEKQQEFMERQQQQKQKLVQSTDKLPYKASGQFGSEKKTEDGGRKNYQTQKSAPDLKSTMKSRGKTTRSEDARGAKKDQNKEEAPKTEESSQRVKKASVNPAAEGAKLDRKGVKYSGEKGKNTFFQKRKANIEEVNKRLGIGPVDDDDDEYITVQGGTRTEDEELKLPPIQGYKTDSLGLGAAGARVLNKYDGYQSDKAGSDKKGKDLYNYKDPAQKRFLESIEQSFRKSIPGSLKQYQEDEDDEAEEQKGKFKEVSKEPRNIPIYEPPETKTHKDWKEDLMKGDQSDGELPDTQKLLEKLKKEGMGMQNTDEPGLKLSIVEGDQTKPEEKKLEEAKPDKEEEKKEQPQKKSGIPKPPPKLSVPSAIIQIKKKGEEEKKADQSQIDPKPKPSASNIRKSLGMTQKGSPRPDPSIAIDEDLDNSKSGARSKSESMAKTGIRGKQSGQSKQPQQRKSQYVPPHLRPKQKPDRETLWGGEDSDDRRQKLLQSKERINQLSQPKAKNYVLIKEEEDPAIAEQKAQSILENVQKGKGVNFSEYVDRDVPYIKNNTIKTPGGVPGEFDTKFNNKSGLFSQIKDQPGQRKTLKSIADDAKYILDKKVKKPGQSPAHGGTTGTHKNQSQTDLDNLPEFLRRDPSEMARPLGREGAFKKALKSSIIKKYGLPGGGGVKKKSTMGFNKMNTMMRGGIYSVKFDMRELREIEEAAAAVIQKYTRGYFTRKWYLNYMVRKKLGVPFSGLEFSQNPFLRQFNKPNVLYLHSSALVAPQVVEVVRQQAEQRNMLKKSYKHGKEAVEEIRKKLKQKELNQSMDETVNDQSQDPVKLASSQRTVPRRIPKGATPQQLLDNLQRDFVAKGLDSYTQFKKLGVGIDHDDQGNEISPNKKSQKVGNEDEDQIDNEPKVPKWRGDLVEENERFVEIKEIDQYMVRIQKINHSKKKAEERKAIEDAVKNDPKKPQKQQFVSSMAAFASVHGAFNSKKAESQNESLASPSKLQADVHSSPGQAEGDEDDIQQLLKRKRKIDDDDDFFPVERYQDFSREAIIFYKKIGDHAVKWTVQAGVAFKKDKKYFMPIRIIGEPFKSRNTIVSYLMNLELLKIPKDIDKNFEYETIWPFILYLFNHWVRHQVRLMGLLDSKPELRGAFHKTEAQMYEVQDFDKGLKEAKEEYDEMLNFSSEIEYDERFDYEKYKLEYHPDRLIDRSLPKEQRPDSFAQFKKNGKDIFQAYKSKINMYEQLVQLEDDELAQFQIDDEGKQRKRVRIQLDDILEPVPTRVQNPFDFFLQMHFVALPGSDTGQYKLMQNLQQLNYYEQMKNNGQIEDNLALMNEERRKRKGLPPLSIIDYNCIDRAAFKIRTILECLFMRRQINGFCLVPRDVKESLLVKEWQVRKHKNLQLGSKIEQLSMDLLKSWGKHIKYENQYNQNAISVQESMKKIQDYKNRRQISIADPDGKLSQNEDFVDNRFKDLDDEVLLQSNRDLIANNKSTNSNKMQAYINQVKQNRQSFKPQSSKHTEDMQNEMNQQQNQQIEVYQQQDALGKLMDQQKKTQEVEDYIREHDILEQGVVCVEENNYIITLVFRKIKSNYENMRAIIDERIQRFQDNQNDQKGEGQNLKNIERMKSRLCEFISEHHTIIEYDKENHQQIKEMERIDIEQEKFMKQRTLYKSYAEVKVCSKISTTNWDDSFNLRWESLIYFFQKFNIKWKPEDFMKRRRFNNKERFTFYNFIQQCMFIYDCKIHFDLMRLDVDRFKFEKIYLNIDEIRRQKVEFDLKFYYDDYLDENFDESIFDNAIFPYYEDPRLLEDYFDFDEQSVYHKYELREEDREGQSVVTTVEEKPRKPELLVDEATKIYLSDPKNMFNLTLTNFPQSDGIYLGQILIGSHDTYKNAFNLRIDYYVLGYTPELSIKAFSQSYYDTFDLRVTNKKIIKDVIRICNQSNNDMVVNQLQSMLSINKKINGKYLKLNFNNRKDKNVNLGQNYINMLICNETLLRTMQNEKFTQFQGIVYFDNLGGRMLVTVTEFTIEVEQLTLPPQELALLHGNKHISEAHIKSLHEKGVSKNLLIPKKRFQKLQLWKVNIFNIFTSKNYDAVVSQEDLLKYYQSDVFQFYEKNPNKTKPNLVFLLQDYIRNLYIYKTRTGSILYWKLPLYKRPLDENGQPKNVPPDHLFELEILNIYQTLQKRIDEQNKHDDINSLPFSLDQMKAKKHSREPPSLSLRNKLICEKELPIYSPNDTRILKLTSSAQEVLVQMPKVFSSLMSRSYCIVTVILYPHMECWIWQIYFLKTQRTFSVTFYPSDLFNMDHDILNFNAVSQGKNPAVGLWGELIRRAELQQNSSGDILLVVETYREPLKEILFQDHVFNENARDIFFMDVTLKSYNNYVTDVRYSFYPMDLEQDDMNDWTISIRAYSLTRNLWIKDYQPLSEVVRILKKENYLTGNVKLLYYSMLRDAATLLSHKIVFSEEAKTVEVKKKKLTYDLRQIINNKEDFQRLQEEFREPTQADKKKILDRRDRQDSFKKNEDILADSASIKQREEGLKSEWRNLIELNKIIYQTVVAQNPTQVCTIIYNDVKDLFIYRLYRSSDCSVFEKRLSSNEIQKTCAPNYQVMIKNKMSSQLGQRIADYYKTNMLVASLMSYYKIKQ